MMFHELDAVVLVHSREEYGLSAGDVGSVVHVDKDIATYEVEFVTGEGETVAVLTLKESDIRPMRSREILHVRRFAPVT